MLNWKVMWSDYEGSLLARNLKGKLKLKYEIDLETETVKLVYANSKAVDK